jgi:hypothetical protein
MVKRNNFCALQYEGIGHHVPKIRDISNVEAVLSAVIMHALCVKKGQKDVAGPL